MTESRTIDIFQRVEDKYRISRQEAQEILNQIHSRIHEDDYFRYTVHNVYYDSADSRMIISSLNRDDFKEKLRLRCYEQPSDDTLCFLETKKKYSNIVYKKRIALSHEEAVNYLDYGIMHHVKNNTADEIDYLMNYYNCQPKTLILYERECWSAIVEPDLRITFDSNIRYRIDDVNLTENGSEKSMIGDDVIMEIKAMNRYPIWLVRILSERKLYKQSFSKYGNIYKTNSIAMTDYENPTFVYTANKERRICSVQY